MIRRKSCARPVVVGICLLASCASKPVWTHPTKDSSEWKLDAAECERFFSGSDKAQLDCLTQKGWRRTK
jgi:hypothetical protein